MAMRLVPTGFCLFILMGFTASVLAEDTPPQIRQFDLPTIEKLGREMYEQDQKAWVATDVMSSAHVDIKKENIHGWITEPLEHTNLVRFIRQTDQGTEAAFDVSFFGDKPQLHVPTDRVLAAEELAQFSARRLATQNIEKVCSDTYNTIALRDPQSDGWLVWALAATKQEGVVMMGVHYRFTISSDGKKLLQQDALSHDCMRLSSKAEGGKSLAGLLTTHLVSLTPIETQVFTSIGLQIPLFVGTADGKTWKLDRGQVTNVNEDTPGTDGYSARAFQGMAENCKYIATKENDAEQKFYNIGDPKVIDMTEHVDKFVPDPPLGYAPVSIVCGRQDIVPLPNDYKVLLAGLTLSIVDIGAGHEKRMGTLELSGGQFRYRFEKGDSLPPDLAERIQKRINQLQNATQTK